MVDRSITISVDGSTAVPTEMPRWSTTPPRGAKLVQVGMSIGPKVRSSANNLNQSKLRVFVTPTSADWSPGSDVTVRATYPYSISLLGVVVKSGTLTSSTTERVE